MYSDKENTIQNKCQNLEQFLKKEDYHIEMNNQLKQSITEQQFKNFQFQKLSPQKPLTYSNLQEDQIQNEEDEKIILEETFIRFQELVKKNRLQVSKYLLVQERNRPSVIIKKDRGYLKREYEDLSQRREIAWRGFVNVDDFKELLGRFAFFDQVSWETVLKFINKLGCYNKQRNLVFYIRLISNLNRYKSSISPLTGQFISANLIKKKTFRKHQSGNAIDLIKRSFMYYKQMRMVFQEKIERIMHKKKQKEMEELERIEFQNADQVIEFLREKIVSFQNFSLKEIFEMICNIKDEEDDDIQFSKSSQNQQKMEYLTFESFKKLFIKTNIEVKQEMLEEVFFKFDYTKNDKVSYNEFLGVILGKSSQQNMFQLQTIAEDLEEEIRQSLRQKFINKRAFLEGLQAKNTNRISEEELNLFITSNSDQQFSRIQIKTVFNYLDQDGKRYLNRNEVLQLFEKKNINDEKIQQEIIRQKQQEELVQKEKDFIEEFNQFQYQNYQQKQTFLDFKERNYVLFEQKIELENFCKMFADSFESQMNKIGKGLQDIFLIISKGKKAIDLNTFLAIVNFLIKVQFSEKVSKTAFSLFSQYYSKKMNFESFQNIYDIGKSINSLAIKLRFRFGNKLERIKKKMVEDFQKLDVETCQWHIKLQDFIQILSVNKIILVENDQKELTKEKLLIQKKNDLLINYKNLIPVIFPSSLNIDLVIQNQCARKIQRFFINQRLKSYFSKALKSKQEQEQQTKTNDTNTLKKNKSLEKSKVPKKTILKKPKEQTQQKTVEELKKQERKSVHYHPKEITEFYKPDHSTNKQQVQNEVQQAKTDSQKQKQSAKNKKAPQKQPLSKQLQEILPQSTLNMQEIQFQQQQRSKTEEMCKQLLFSWIENACGFGESIILSKQLQKKYEERPITKDVFICLKDSDYQCLDIMPRCVFTSVKTGRIMFLDKNSILHQYDVANKKALLELNLSVKVPLKRAKIIDGTFDQDSGRLYLLTDAWNLEIWEIDQDNSSPCGRVVLFTENIDTEKAIESCYKDRMLGSFPQFIDMGQVNKSVIIINSTCVNNSIIFVDPISLTVFKILYISPNDFAFSNKLGELIQFFSEKFHEFFIKGGTFEELFKGYIKKNQDNWEVSHENFNDKMYEYFGKDNSQYSKEDWSFLTKFLDQNNSGLIEKNEFEFLREIIKYHQVRIPDQSEHLIKLAGISERAFKLLNQLAKFLIRQKKSIEDAFRAFDADNQGTISYNEFSYIIEKICKGDENLGATQELIQFIDKDKNGSIDFKEFSEIFGIAVEGSNQGNALQFNNRKNLVLCFQAAFQAGIDAEQLILKEDIYQQGTLTAFQFRNILKRLPIGLLDEEIDYIMNNAVSYSDTGSVNYIKLLTSMEFKNMKSNYLFKKSLESEKSFQEYQETVNEEGDIILQKVVIESMIYLDEFDVFIYTTVCPRTSIIFISKAKEKTDLDVFQKQNSMKQKKPNKNKSSDEIFTSVLLAKLIGHKTSIAPSIFYVSQSGCLISGEKLQKNDGNQQSQYSTNNFISNNSLNNTQTFTKNNDFFEFNHNRSADILIWNLQKEFFFQNFNQNKPLNVSPSRVINSAHYDTIISFTYLPYSQLIASTSLDNTIKLWNPVARPFSLINKQGEACQQIKPGYYKKRYDEHTKVNEGFCEIRRIYINNYTCFGLYTFLGKIPIGNKQNVVELFITCELAKTELIMKKPRNQSLIKIFSIDKMKIEVPCNRHDEILPRKYYEQLEDICIERRKKSSLNYQLYLPTQLQLLKAKKTLQQNGLVKILGLLKKISLTRFDESQNYDTKQDLQTLFETFISLPSRQNFIPFLSDVDGNHKITANELYYYLKKFHNLHPLSTQRDKFFEYILEFKSKASKGLFISQSIENELQKKIQEAIQKDGLNFLDEFSEINKEQFQKLLVKLNLYTNEDDFILLMSEIDPFFTNKIDSKILVDKFSSEIIEYKLNYIFKGKELLEQLLRKINTKQKSRLMFFLNQIGDDSPYLKKDEFAYAFDKLNVNVQNEQLNQIFDIYAEKFTPTDYQKVINTKYICKKIFSSNENLVMSKYMQILGKIKSAILSKGYRIDYLFLSQQKQQEQMSQEEQETNIQQQQSLVQVNTSIFVQRIIDMNIDDLTNKEIKYIAEFLSEENNNQYVQVSVFLNFAKKVPIKYQYLLYSHYKLLYNELSSLLKKQDFINSYLNSLNKKNFSVSEIRYFLVKMEVSQSFIDDILVQFLPIENFIFHNTIPIQGLLDQFNEFLNQHLKLRSPNKQFEEMYEEEQNRLRSQKVSLSDIINVRKKTLTKGNELEEEISKNAAQKYYKELKKTLSNKKGLILNIISKRDEEEKKGWVEIHELCNIIKYNLPNIKQELLINFIAEYIHENSGSTNFDYNSDFFAQDTTQDNSGVQSRKSSEKIDINVLIEKIVEKQKESNVNINYALKFMQNEQGLISVQDLLSFFDLLRLQFHEEEKEVLISFFTQNSYSINAGFFLEQIYICKKNVANTYNERIWKIASLLVDQYTLEIAKINQNYIQRFIKQKANQQVNNNLQWPLVEADVFNRILTEQMSHDFDQKQIFQLEKFATVGCSRNEQVALQICEDLKQQVKNQNKKITYSQSEQYIINMNVFLNGLNEMVAYKKKEKSYKSSLELEIGNLQNIYDKDQYEEQDEELGYLKKKIHESLRNNNISVWEAFSFIQNSNNQQMSDLINYMNLKLTFQEKVLLIQHYDVRKFIQAFQQVDSEKDSKVILEKIENILFENEKDISNVTQPIKRLSVTDRTISNAIQSHNIPLTQLEIEKLVQICQVNNNLEEQEQFIKNYKFLIEKFKICPLKDAETALLMKLKTLKGQNQVDLLQSFEEIDIQGKGFVYVKDLKNVLRIYGIQNVRNSDLLILFNLYTKNQQNKNQKDFLDQKINYQDFINKINAEIEIWSQNVLEKQNLIIKKIHNIFESKNITLFEAFVHFDVKQQCSISKIELLLGLKNLNIYLNEDQNEFDTLWKAFESSEGGEDVKRINFNSFFTRFIQAEAVQIIKFEETLENKVKNFAKIITKFSNNYFQIFNKLDFNNNKAVTLAELKEISQNNYLGFKSDEIEFIFRKICKNERVFKYKQFVDFMDSYLDQKKIRKNATLRFLQKTSEKKIDWKSKLFPNNLYEISLSKLKEIIQEAKIGLNQDEIDLIINSFKSQNITFSIFQQQILLFSSKEDPIIQQRQSYENLRQNIKEYLEKNKVTIAKMFKDFNNSDLGKLRLGEFNNMLRFMQIKASNNTIRGFFAKIDTQQLHYITLQDLYNVLNNDQWFQNNERIEKANKERQNAAKVYQINQQIKENLKAKNKNLIQEIYEMGFKEQDTLTVKSLENLLTNMHVILKEDDVEFYYNTICQSAYQQEQQMKDQSINFQSFIDFSIKQQIEALNDDGSGQSQQNKSTFIHPTVIVCVNKIAQIIKQNEVDVQKLFKYFNKSTHSNPIEKREMLKMVQSLDKNFKVDEILFIYKYFDEYSLGEVTYDVFCEKFEYILYSSIDRLKQEQNSSSNNQSQLNYQQQVDFTKLSHKQLAFNILQNIYFQLSSDKQQIKNAFDVNGNGVISRNEFLDVLKQLNLQFEFNALLILTNFLDKSEKGIILVSEIINLTFESVPQQYKKINAQSNVIKIFNQIIQRLQNNTPKILQSIIQSERIVRPSNEQKQLFRIRSGILHTDFFKIMKSFGILFSEVEKDEIKSFFLVTINTDYYDLEQIYTLLLQLYEQKYQPQQNSQNINQFISQQVVLPDELWEETIYKKIAEYLRQNNLDIKQLFDKDYITMQAFTSFIESLQLNMSSLNIQSFIKQYFQENTEFIPIENFNEQFWNQYIKLEREEIIQNNMFRVYELKQRNKNLLIYFYSKLKVFSNKNPFKAWNIFTKLNEIMVTDFENSCIKMGIYLTQAEIMYLFGFIKNNPTNTIDSIKFIDFLDFCLFADVYFMNNQSISEIENLESSGGGRNSILEEEQKLLQHLAMVIAQKDIQLWRVFKELDEMNYGYLNKKQFYDFIQSIGIRISNDTKLQQFMLIIDPKQNQIVTLSSMETRMFKYGIYISERQVVEVEKQKDKPMKMFIIQLSKEIKKDINLEQYLNNLDEDFDGFLTTSQFFSFFKQIEKKGCIIDNSIQRICHRLQINQQDKLDIKNISTILQKEINETEIQLVLSKNKNDPYQNYITLDLNLFGYVILYFDGFANLFSTLKDIRSLYILTKKFLKDTQNKYKMRGFNLISKQKSFKEINTYFKKLQGSFSDVIHNLRKQSTDSINDLISQAYLDPDKNTYAIIDTQNLDQSKLLLQQSQNFNFINETHFEIDENSLSYLTPYIKYYSGILFQDNTPIDIFVYTKESLNFVCSDGNQFSKILDFELKMHQMLQSKYDFMVKNIGVFTKQIGHETDNIQYFVINEAIDPSEYVCLSDLITQNGGLIKIPNLVKLKSVTYIAKYIGRQILNIIQILNNYGCVLNILRPENLYVNRKNFIIKLSNVRGVGQFDSFSKIVMVPDLDINLVQKVGPLQQKYQTELKDYKEFFTFTSKNSKMNDFAKIYKDNLHTQPFLAPEQILKKSSEWTAYVDVWTFGCLMYNILFGKPPQSFYQSLIQYSYKRNNINFETFTEPSKYFHYDIFSDEIVQEILRFDYNEFNYEQQLQQNEPKQKAMVKAIDKQSFGSIFDSIFNQNEPEFRDLGNILNIISACFQYQPFKRPSIQGLLSSQIFQMEDLDSQRALDLFQMTLFYTSPSVTLGKKAFEPLRQLAAFSIEHPEQVDTYQPDLLRIIDYVVQLVSFNQINIENDFSFSHFGDNITTNSFYLTKNSIPKKMKSLLKQCEKERNRNSNAVLIQFIFDNDIIDLLVFIVLRHHKQISDKEKKLGINISRQKAIQNKQKILALRESSIRVLTALKQLFSKLFEQLDSYNNPCAPFVNKLLRNFVKFFIGEEYMLNSDLIYSLNKMEGQNQSQFLQFVPERNLHSEYSKVKNFDRFFKRNVDSHIPDQADKAWSKVSFTRPYIFQSRNWSPILYNILSELMKKTVGESGLGKGNMIVLIDYIKFCSEKYVFSEFDFDKKKKILNDQINQRLPKSSDYYNDIINVAESLSILHECDQLQGNPASLKIVLNYFMSILRSNNTDKIKLFLDSRAPIYLISFLNTDDIHVRQSLLEIFLEISRGFTQLNYSYHNQRELRSEEVNKNFGIVAHIKQINEDKLDRKRFIECANNYFYLKQQINKQYLYQLAFVFETPILITSVFSIFKTQAELINSKILALNIFKNLTHAPITIIKNLNTCSLDVFPSILRLLIKPKQGQEQKINKVLAPIVKDIFKEIIQICRSEIIDIMEYTPGIKGLLKEGDLYIPQKINLNNLSQQFEQISHFYKNSKDTIVKEIKEKHGQLQNLKNLQKQTQKFLDHIINWFKFYLLPSNDASIIVEAKILVNYICRFTQRIIMDLKDFAQLNEIVYDIITNLSVFLENISNMNLIYILFNKNDQKFSQQLLQWMFDLIKQIYDYHNQQKDEAKLKQYMQCKLTNVAHIYMRIIISLTGINNDSIYNLLNNCQFGRFYIDIVKLHHKLTIQFINLQNENIHILQNYVEETNFRIIAFENILSSKNSVLKDYLLENDFIKYICLQCFQNETEFQVGLYRSSIKFLPFRNFAPLRNEALSIITAIVWHKNISFTIYNELIIQIANLQLIKKEYLNILKYKSQSNPFLSSLYFFTLLVKICDDKILFQMKFEKVFEILTELFQQNEEYKKLFPILYNASEIQKQQ